MFHSLSKLFFGEKQKDKVKIILDRLIYLENFTMKLLNKYEDDDKSMHDYYFSLEEDDYERIFDYLESLEDNIDKLNNLLHTKLNLNR